MINIEEIQTKFIHKYIRKEKQDRYLGFLSNPKNRNKFTEELCHFKDFNYGIFEVILKNEKEILLNRLKTIKTTDTCFVISNQTKYDNKILNIKDVFENIIGFGFDIILIFGNADVVYYEGEDERLISK